MASGSNNKVTTLITLCDTYRLRHLSGEMFTAIVNEKMIPARVKWDAASVDKICPRLTIKVCQYAYRYVFVLEAYKMAACEYFRTERTAIEVLSDSLLIKRFVLIQVETSTASIQSSLHVISNMLGGTRNVNIGGNSD